MPVWRELPTMRYLWERPHALDDPDLRAPVGSMPHTPLPQALHAALVDLNLPVAAPTPARA